jgi:hypothetical protein
MKGQRTWFLIMAILALVTVLVFAIYRLASVSIQTAESPLNAVPDNTALIIKINNPGSLWEELNRSNLIWKSLSHYPAITTIRTELHLFDSISRRNKKINSILQRYNLVITLTLSGRTSFGAIYITSAPGSDPGKTADEFAREIFGDSARITQTPYASTSIHRLQVTEKSPPFYYTTVKGIFIGSFLADLVKKSTDRLTFNTPAFQSSGFHKVEAPSGKKADANIYINYRMLALALSKISRTENHYALIRFAHLASWSGLDVIIKNDELFLNGYTLAEDTTLHYLNLFTGQSAQSNDLSMLIPENIAYYAFFGWEDPAAYFERMEMRNQQDELEGGNPVGLSAINHRYRLNLSDFFLPWMGKQAIVFAQEADSRHGTNRVYAAFQVRDSLLAISLLDSLAMRMGLKRDSLKYKGYKIIGFHFKDVLQNLFGSLFEPAGQSCITFIDKVMVFGKDQASLKYLIDEQISGYTLNRNKDYIGFEGKMSPKSNIFIYFNTSMASGAMHNMLDDPLLSALHPYVDSLMKFHPVGIQYSSHDGLFYTSLVIGYTPNLQKEGPLRWQARLDTTITGSPQILNSLTSGDPVIMARDTSNNLYQYGSDGLLRWKIHFMGKMLSRIKPITLPDSDTIFYFFNTDSHLYLLRSDGQPAKDYPKRFPIPATNSLTVVNFDRRKDYRIFIAFNDKRVYQFDISGRTVMRWERPQMKSDIIHTVEYIVSNHKDFFFIRDKEGHLIITDRQGKQRIRVGPLFRPADHSSFYPVKLAQKGLFLTSGPAGKLIFIQENGKTAEVTLDRFSDKHWFFNEDIMGTVVPEYIFIDKNKISYYSRSYKLIYSYVFRREINREPFVLHDQRDKQTMIGLTFPQTGELYLFDSKGYYPMEPGIGGNTPFDIGHLDEGKSLNLLVGAGKYLRNYILPER